MRAADSPLAVAAVAVTQSLGIPVLPLDLPVDVLMDLCDYLASRRGA